MRSHSSEGVTGLLLHFRFHPEPAHVKFVLDKIILGQVFLPKLPVCSVSIFPKMHHTSPYLVRFFFFISYLIIPYVLADARSVSNQTAVLGRQ